MWSANYILVAVRWHTVVTCTRHASSNPALSAGTERKKLWYTHTHTQMPLTQAEAVFWSHRPPDWLRTLDETHATIPASPYLRMIGCNHNTWHSDTDLALVLQRRKSGICVWIYETKTGNSFTLSLQRTSKVLLKKMKSVECVNPTAFERVFGLNPLCSTSFIFKLELYS